jgi:UDP-N-acetylglucosamine 2-epimerase (non-hydrolysing)
MPEEINRMVTDSITDYFFTTSATANQNLAKSGVSDDQVFFVGNTMIDTLLKNMQRFVQPPIWSEAKLEKGRYFVITLHRPANVDEEEKLNDLLTEIIKSSVQLPVIFPVHPRTAKVLDKMGPKPKNLFLVEPLSYLEFNYLVQFAKAVVTDSGGITEETTVMGVPCMTLRNNTERPETCTLGTNQLIGTDPKNIAPAFRRLFDGKWQTGEIPEMWDGKAAARIVNILSNL